MARKKPKAGRKPSQYGHRQPARANLSRKSSKGKVRFYFLKTLKLVLRFGYFNGIKLGRSCRSYAQDVVSDSRRWSEAVTTAYERLRCVFQRKDAASLYSVASGGSVLLLGGPQSAPRRSRPVIMRPVLRFRHRLEALPGIAAEKLGAAWNIAKKGILWAATGVPLREISFPIPSEDKKRYIAGVGARSISVGAPAAALIAFAVLLYSAKDLTMGVKVYIGGQQVGIVENQESYEKLVDGVESYIASITGEPYVLNIEPSFTVALVDKKEFENQSELSETLYAKASDAITTGYGLYVDGQLIGITSDGEGLQSRLNAELDQFRTGSEGERAEFVQDVQLKKALFPKRAVKELSYIEAQLNTTTTQEKTYVVQKGDVFGTIAEKVGMRTSLLMNLNSGVEPTKLKEGMELIIEKAVPLLSVQLVKTVEYTEAIPFSTEKIKTDELYLNYSKVKVKGVNGEAQVKAEIVMVDGVETQRNILSRDVVSEPVTQQVLMGTKKPPAEAPTGLLMRPFGGVVTSRFGYRGREYHTGVDLAGAKGSPIVAADGGTVVFAGWSGNYGYLVKIDHGGGIQTWYGHCSKLYVSAGQKVAKGTLIAAVGSTGRSTGPHVHFEVRKNGVPQNPFNYIN